MGYLLTFLRFWYGFIVGDDWVAAAAVIALLAATRLLAVRGVDAWWLMPLGAIGLLGYAIASARLAARRKPEAADPASRT